MSNTTNDLLFERAAEMVDYWEGTLHAKVIHLAMETGDLDLLRQHVVEAEAEASRQEMYGGDVL
jgi:hypothetical protein